MVYDDVDSFSSDDGEEEDWRTKHNKAFCLIVSDQHEKLQAARRSLKESNHAQDTPAIDAAIADNRQFVGRAYNMVPDEAERNKNMKKAPKKASQCRLYNMMGTGE